MSDPTLQLPAEPKFDSGSSPSRWELAILGAGVSLAALAFVLAWSAAAVRPHYDHATGSLFVIASDILHGTWYRPLWSAELGYGGTRYFPLYPALLALWRKLGLDFLSSSLMISAVCCWFVVTGVRSLLREFGVESKIATIFAFFPLCATSVLMVVTSFRADLLPVALALWGVRYGLRAGTDAERRGDVPLSALLFTLAFAAKVTSLGWAFGLLAFLALNGRRRAAVRIGAWLAAGAAAFLAGVTAISHGRFLENMAATMGGGSGLARFLEGPYYLERMARAADPICFVMAGIAAWLAASNLRRSRASLPAWLLASIAVVTAVIFGSRGTIHNHLIDLCVAATLVVAADFRRLRTAIHFVPLLLATYALISLVNFPREYVQDPSYDVRGLAVRHLSTQPGPWLSEDPSLPLSAGQSPYLADAFMLRLLRQSHPEIEQRLEAQIRGHFFKTVVLTNMSSQRVVWYDTEAYPWYDRVHFGPGFLETLNESYTLSTRIGRFWFYSPKGAEPVADGE